jgi:hypothetical protein
MQVLRSLALAAVLGAAVAPAALPAAALAQAQPQAQPQPPTKQQLETAVKAANPTFGQLRQLKKLEPNIPNMTPAQLKQALGGIFTMDQLVVIKQSLKAQGVALPST